MACKYYNKHMDTILEYCKCLYKLEGCGAGGLLHILLDDDNIDDDDILFCYDMCVQHPEAEESELGKLICTELLKLSTYERKAFDWYWNHRDISADDCCLGMSCDECEILEEDY